MEVCGGSIVTRRDSMVKVCGGSWRLYGDSYGFDDAGQ